MDFLSGLLLVAVAVTVVAYIVKELIWDERTGDAKARDVLARTVKGISGGEAKPVNEHLIGLVGEVTAHTGDSDRPIRVRLGAESWPARLESTEGSPPPVGDTVSVVAVEGAVVVVTVGAAPAAAPQSE